MKKIRSVLNCTPHVLIQCECGWEGAPSIDAVKGRNMLFKHMRQNNCKTARMEVGRVSHYELVED